MNDLSLKNYINGRECHILGLGISNLPLAKKLCDMGAILTVHDKKDISALGEGALELSRRGVKFVLGEHCFDDLGCGLIFRSPGIRPDLDGIKRALAEGAELTSEIELFLSLTRSETFGITGSDGKTTSTTLTGKFLEAEAMRGGFGKVFIGGNIGEPLLYRNGQIGENDRTVMELSSFQLMTMSTSPKYAAITNISENHMDWHKGSMEEYIGAKLHIIGRETLRLVTNADCPETRLIGKIYTDGENRPDIFLFSSTKGSFDEIFNFKTGGGDRAIFIKNGSIIISDGNTDTALLPLSDIKLPGQHNIENYMTAIGLTYGSVDSSVYSEVARSFYGVRHRLEPVRTLDGVDYINSSIDSSPTRTAAALSALSGRDIVIILGGYDKKLPYAPLCPLLCKNVRAAVLTGATGKIIEEALLSCPDYKDSSLQIVYTPDFRDAVERARTLARQGGCVLLSPASASFDCFKNFEERGNTFCEIVNNFKSYEN